jgi:hypothetical protein
MNIRRSTLPVAAALLVLAAASPAGAVNTDLAVPFQFRIDCNQHINVNLCSGQTVSPKARLLIVQYVSVYCSLSGTSTRVSNLTLGTRAGGVDASHQLNIPDLVVDGANRNQIGGQVVGFYADPGTTISVVTRFANSTANQNCSYTLAGQSLPV